MNQIHITPWSKIINGIASWLLGLLWVLPLLYMVWAAFHSGSDAISFDLSSPWRLDNFFEAWTMAPFVTYMWNTFCFVTLLLALQIVVCTLALYALARLDFKGKSIIFGAILLQLMIMPEALISENYQRIANLNAIDTYWAIALPYIASAFGIFLLRQTFMQVPQELEDAARVEGLSRFATILKVYVPLAKPTYLAYGLVSISYHWNNFLWYCRSDQHRTKPPYYGWNRAVRLTGNRGRLGRSECGNTDFYIAFAGNLSYLPKTIHAVFYEFGS